MKNYILLMVAVFAVIMASNAQATWLTESTPQMMGLVKDASALIHIKGEAAFSDFRVPGSRWREGETYIFVLNPAGDMLVHPDPAMEGKNQLGLEDVNGKPIIRGLLAAATTFADKP